MYALSGAEEACVAMSVIAKRVIASCVATERVGYSVAAPLTSFCPAGRNGDALNPINSLSKDDSADDVELAWWCLPGVAAKCVTPSSIVD